MTPGEKLKHLPTRPGVYMFRDGEGRIIYVGKALSLRNRVRSYFQEASKLAPKVRSMMERAADFEYIVTDSEMEALILESNLIKEHRPRYNIFLKDDKSYPFLKVTLGEEYPRVHITRRVLKDGSRYFGPYTQVGAVHETLNLLRKLFPFRTCRQKLPLDKGRPCLNYHIKRCLGPCCGLVDRESYNDMLREVCLFLEGRQEDLMKRLTRRMEAAAENLEFEKAAAVRDQLQAVGRVVEKQKIISAGGGDQDIIAMAGGEGESCVMVFFVRGGKLLGRERFLLPHTDELSPGEIVTGFVKQYYNRADYIPGEIIMPGIIPEESGIITEWLSRRRGGRVHLKVPARGDKKKLLEMVARNAQLALDEARLERLSRRGGPGALEELARGLGLKEAPRRIECYDISNIQGAETVASMVVFEDGESRKDQYRRFKIRGVEGPNDYASMEEALSRRFARGKEERELVNAGRMSSRQAGFCRLPDLVIIDGGRGQLSAARQAMRELGFEGIPAFGLAKEEELLFAEGSPEPIALPRDSRALYLLQSIRDEAHRFAVTYHRQLRTKRNLKSLLDEIEGVGSVRRKALLKAFPTMEALGGASVEELAGVPGMNRKAARAVYEFFRREGG